MTPPTDGGFLVDQDIVMLSHVGREVLGHFFHICGDDQSPRLGQGSAVLAYDVEKHHPGSREGVKMHLGLPRDGDRTLGHGGPNASMSILDSEVSMLTT